MSHLSTIDLSLQQAIPNNCTAKTLPPSQRLELGVQALAGQRSITELANQSDVSRKFVYQQADRARDALQDAFDPTTDEDQVFFYLPVTKAWLRQLILGLILICHSSYRGVIELCRDLFDTKLSLGTVHNVVHQATDRARQLNDQVDLQNVEIAGLDEIFQAGQPVLVGADIHSTYCFLLTEQDHRDGDTWGVRLLELTTQGFDPEATIADFGSGLRSGAEQALPEKPCRGDVFHALRDVRALVNHLNNRAYGTIVAHDKLNRQRNKLKQKAQTKLRGQLAAMSRKVTAAAGEQHKAVSLADDVAILCHWLQKDVFAVSGLAYADRCAGYDFIVAQLQARQELCPHRIGPVVTMLKNHKAELLAFAAALQGELNRLALDFEVPVPLVGQMVDMHQLDRCDPHRWQREAKLRTELGGRFCALAQAVSYVLDQVVRSSSIIENINSRLRNYFFLRRQLGNDYLQLLQFFLNHRRFLRSECDVRVGKSPRELLTGVEHCHWLELLGYKLFCRN